MRGSATPREENDAGASNGEEPETDTATTEATEAAVEGGETEQTGPPPDAPAHGFRAQQEPGADLKPPGLLTPPPTEGTDDPERTGPPQHAPAHGIRGHQGDDGEDRGGGPPFTPPGLGDRPAPPSNADDPTRDGPPDHAPAHGRGSGESPDASEGTTVPDTDGPEVTPEDD